MSDDENRPPPNNGGSNDENRPPPNGSTVLYGGGASNSIDKLAGAENWISWKFAIRMALILEDLWDQVEGVQIDPAKNRRALARIALSVKPSLYQYINKAKTASEAWKKLTDTFEDKGLYRRVLLLRKLHRVEYIHFTSMLEYIEAVTTLVQQLADIGKIIDDQEVAELLLSGLPEEYDSLVSGLETLCISSKLNSEIVRARLLQEAYRKCTTETSNAFITKKIDFKNMTCNYCQRKGHTKAKCFKLRRDRRNKKEQDTSTASAFIAREVSDIYVDSGCSFHMVNDKQLLCNLRNCQPRDICVANNTKLVGSQIGDINIKCNNEEEDPDILKNCEACLKGKFSAEPFPKDGAKRASQPLQLVHTDVCGPMTETSLGGAKYLVTFTDDMTRKSFGYLIQHKSQMEESTAQRVMTIPALLKSL